MRHARLATVVAVALSLFACVAVLSSAGSDAASGTDPGYRDPPAADYTLGILNPLDFTSQDSAYTITWTFSDTTGATDTELASSFVSILGFAYIEGALQVEECLPSWISWDVVRLPDASFPDYVRFELTICPALQQVSEDTTGDYWIWFDTNAQGNRATFLLEFSVNVIWAGSVVVPDEYSIYRLEYDYGLGGPGNHYDQRQVSSSADSGRCTFAVPSTHPDRDGFVFLGWSTEPGASVTNVGDVLSVYSDGPDTVVGSVDGHPTYTVTLHAVWQEVDSPSLSIPDPLRDLLDFMSDPVVILVFLVIVLGFALLVRSRRSGRW